MKTALALLVLGLLQIFEDVLGLASVRGLAAATSASPAPRVFSAVQGLETYSSRFFIEWEEAGELRSHELTPERYGRLRGPYPRRNAYGASVAYGPLLASRPASRALYLSVTRYALCGERRLLRELDLLADGQKIQKLRVRLEPRPGSNLGQLPTTLEAPCP